jgi:hypothetical protein
MTALILKYLLDPRALRALMLFVVFMFGVGVNSYIHEHNRLKSSERALAKGQESVLKYIKQMGEDRDESNQIIEDVSQGVDAPVAPIIRDYFTRLQKRQ